MLFVLICSVIIHINILNYKVARGCHCNVTFYREVNSLKCNINITESLHFVLVCMCRDTTTNNNYYTQCSMSQTFSGTGISRMCRFILQSHATSWINLYYCHYPVCINKLNNLKLNCWRRFRQNVCIIMHCTCPLYIPT